MHRCDVRKAFRRLKHKKCVGCASPPFFLEDLAHPTHIFCSFWCVGGVLLSHNPTIAVPSAQSSLATGIGTGPGVPSTLKPPTQTHETTTTPTPQQGAGSVLRQTLYNKHKHDNHFFILLRQTYYSRRITALLNCPHMKNTRCVILCRCISTSHLQHVTMLTALAYQPHHLWGTSTETSSQNRLPA